MRAILDFMAAHPGEDVSASELIDVLSRSREAKANSKILGGTFSAFGRRIWARYKMENFPFDWWVDDKKQLHYRMDPQVARLLQKVARLLKGK